MKILRIISSVDPQYGGPIEGLKQSSHASKQLGHETHVVSLDTGDEDYINDFPLTLHCLGPSSLGAFAYSKKIKPWLKNNSENYDAIIVHGLWQYTGLATRQVLRKKKQPYHIFTHGMLDPWFKREYPLKHLKKCLYWFWGEYLNLKYAENVFFTSQEEMVQSRKSFSYYDCNEKVLSYGTVGQQGDEAEQRKAFLTKFPQLQNKKYLLYLSRIHPKKGIDLLIKSFSENTKLSPDTYLVIAGPDKVGWQKKLESLALELGIADKIIWTGMLSGNDKWGAYLNADAFILPSHQENFGIVVAEALSCKTPVLISNKVNIWREIESDYAGLVEPDTLEGCSNLIKKWFTLDENSKHEISSNAYQTFLARFEINHAAKTLIEAIS